MRLVFKNKLQRRVEINEHKIKGHHKKKKKKGKGDRETLDTR